jgi:bifunctional DNA-binding transcriptional regulator/antitoxin component of YhaV-PrlF toxin-antitoxin module
MNKTITTPIVVPEAVRRKAGLRAGQPVEFRVSGRSITIGPQRGDRLRERLIAGYRANAERDRATATDWFPLEEEARERLEKTTRTAARKRITRRS